MMDRYAATRARARILSYYSQEPNERALKKERDPFERAKAEWLKNARAAIEDVEAMTFEEWQATRETFKARKPDECFECGQQYRHSTANVEVRGASRLAGEASSREAATSTAGLEGGTGDPK